MAFGESTSAEVERVGAIVVDASLTVHRVLGPGLLESVYEVCLAHELTKRGLRVERQVFVPVVYDNVRLDAGLRLDLVVQDLVIIEVKSVEKLIPVFDAQILTYLKLTEKQLAFLINFNVPMLKDGLKRIVRSKPIPPIHI